MMDQGTKLWAIRALPLWQSRPLLPPLLRLTRVENQGAAFSLLPGAYWLFVAMAVGMVAAAWAFRRVLFSAAAQPAGWGVAFVLGGTAGNLLDRLRWGYVVDFLELPHWPVFNIADASIVAGMGLVLWGLMRWDGRPAAGGGKDKP
ncbi:MAG: signal peptidase II [Limnochordaceae bacterium]|nr:signal peptidase II [Limnochordaceae bacterium]